MDYLNTQNNQDDQNDADVKRKRNDLQREMIMLEADQRKKLEEKTRLEAEIRAVKKEISREKVAMQERQTELKKIDQEIFQIDGEIKGLKKKINLL